MSLSKKKNDIVPMKEDDITENLDASHTDHPLVEVPVASPEFHDEDAPIRAARWSPKRQKRSLLGLILAEMQLLKRNVLA